MSNHQTFCWLHTQCGTFKIFVSLRFYVKSILRILQGLQGQKGIFDFQITGWKINILHNHKAFFKSRQKHNFDQTIQFLCTVVIFLISTSFKKYGILIVSYPSDTKFSNNIFALYFGPNSIANYWLAKQKIQNDK